jgi:hypothetical protein
MSAWWIVAMVPVALWAIWQLLDLVGDLLRQAAHKQAREDAKATKGKGSSVW